MPPINVEVKVGERKVSLPTIFAGGTASITDADPNGENVLTVICNPQDNGGIIYRQDVDKTTEILDGALRIVDPSDGKREVVLHKDESLSIDIHTKFGQATLVLTQFN